MSGKENSADVRAIEAVIARQFRNIGWTREAPADWDGFAADFLPGATLYPAARPAKPQSVAAFVERMRGLAQGTLRTFEETVLGTEIHVFGNVAVALGACRILENGETTSRGVEAMLLVKEAGAWKIVSQAWDLEREGNPIPDQLLRGAG